MTLEEHILEEEKMIRRFATIAEVKALVRWLNTYAFAGWLLSEHTEMSVEEMIRISEEEDEEYQKLLEEFNQAKLEVVEKAGEEE